MGKSSKVEKSDKPDAQEKTEQESVPQEKPWHPRQLFVSGIPYTSTENDLRDFFKEMEGSLG